MKRSAREAYNELFKYFGLRSKDAYLSTVTGVSQPPPSGDTSNSGWGEIYHLLYGDDETNPEIEEICEKIAAHPLKNSEKVLCITPYIAKDFNVTNKENLPLNNPTRVGYKEQGLIGKKGNSKDVNTSKLMSTTGLNPKIFDSDASNKIDVIQVFPCGGVSELADTDVLTLYLSTINSVNMSLAVPYVDVTVSTERTAGSKEQEPFSFGSFLGASNADTALNSKFKDQTISSNASARPGREISTVASMEIFTSPQTLVNASPDRIRYNENNDVGRHIDAFRPFMAIESIDISVVPANAGLIAFKTAKMKLRLFDRGNLSKISPIVAPSRFGLVKFDIEYGWSHPAGRTKVGRVGDANDDRIGQLIDSMRVTESYQVVNSNFSFEQDGSVSIDLKLSMLGRKGLSDSPLKLSSSDADAVEIAKLLEEIKRFLSNAPKGINIPSYITGGADTFINMPSEEQKKLRKLVGALRSGKFAGAKEAAETIGTLIGKKSEAGSALSKFKKSRDQFVNDFIKNLKESDDPFIRFEGLSGTKGITATELKGDSNFKFASLGSIIINTVGPVLQDVGDVIFVFNCFNKNAGAMYDHNISQFPVRLEGANDKQVTLSTAMKKLLKKNSKITPETFLNMLNETFILRQDSEAYGLGNLYKDTPVYDENGNIKAQGQKGAQVNAESKEGQLVFEEKKTENLKSIYGNRTNPSFTTPRLTMKVDVKPSKDGKPIVRVIIFDQAASNVGDIQEVFEEVTSSGYFMQEDYKTIEGVRGAQHGTVANEAIKELERLKLIEKFPETLETLEETQGNGFKFANQNQVREQLKKMFRRVDFSSADTKLRNVFYSLFPTLIYGSMGSGIISAQLTSNQNDALTTISLQRQESDPEVPVGLPMLIHPTQLTMEVFGTPMFKYSQKFFVDFGTGTSADNFYVITGVDMNFAPGEFKTSLKMTQLDVFGRFMKTQENILKTMVSSFDAEKAKAK
jgi:hypothetical protein